MAENPPAFPSVEEHPSYDMPMHHFGMTLRDWFAGQALIETSGRSHDRGLAAIQAGSPMHPALAAKAAYAFADAMLSARTPTPTSETES